MTKKEQIKLNWLYPKNIDFHQKRLDIPVNYKEIRRTFMIRYGVIDAPLFQRWGMAILQFFGGLMLIMFLVVMLIMIPTIFLEDSDVQVSDLFCIIPMMLIAVIGILAFSKSVLGLILHREKAVERSLKRLLQEGSMLPVSIIDYTIVPSGYNLRYEFINPKGKKIKANYLFKSRRKNVPKSAVVWYCNNKTHTLL